MSVILAFRRDDGGRTERRSVESVAERNRAEARIKDLDGSLCVQPEQPAPERPESTKRGRSVNRGREAWPQEKKTKKSCCCTADAKMLDRGTCYRHYELVSPLWRFFSLFPGNAGKSRNAKGNGSEVTKYLCTDVRRAGYAERMRDS